jgi:hypothetical protein
MSLYTLILFLCFSLYLLDFNLFRLGIFFCLTYLVLKVLKSFLQFMDLLLIFFFFLKSFLFLQVLLQFLLLELFVHYILCFLQRFNLLPLFFHTPTHTFIYTCQFNPILLGNHYNLPFFFHQLLLLILHLLHQIIKPILISCLSPYPLLDRCQLILQFFNLMNGLRRSILKHLINSIFSFLLCYQLILIVFFKHFNIRIQLFNLIMQIP